MFSMTEFLKTEMPKPTRAVIKKFVDVSQILRVIPWDSIIGPGSPFNRQTGLPTPTKRAVGETYTHSQSTIDPGFEALKIQGGKSTFDAFQVATGGGSRRTTEIEAFLEAIALNFNRDFIKGDQATDPRDFDGLQVRLSGAQVIQADPAAGTVHPLSIKQALETKKRVRNPTHWVMSDSHQNWLTVMAHDRTVGGYITRTKDQMGDEVMNFCNLPVQVLDVDAEDTEVLDFTEAVTAGGNDGSSIYCVSFRPDRLHGIQNAFPQGKDLGLDPTNGTQYHAVVDWYAAIKMEHARSAARLRDIADAMPTLNP
jgi:hypothetical protein